MSDDGRDRVAEMRRQKVVYLGKCSGDTARVLADEIDAGDVTHAALIYRRANGDICCRLIGHEDLTFIIGMVERAQIDLHCADASDDSA